MDDYKIMTHQIIFEIPQRMRIVQHLLAHQGRHIPYVYIESPVEAVAVVAIDAQQQIILTRQYRHAIRRTIYDLPGGNLHPGEDPLVGARRELEEETGLVPAYFVPLGYYNQFPSSINVGTRLFFARDLQPTQQRLDEGEELEVCRLPLATVLTMIVNNEIVDGSLQLGLLLALQKRLIAV